MLELARTPGAAVRRGRGTRADLVAVAIALAVVATAVVVGWVLRVDGVPLYTASPPLVGRWLPHLGPGTPLVVGIAVVVVGLGATVARRLALPRLLMAGYLCSVAWTVSLALVDGWARGVTARMTLPEEYLPEIPRVRGVGAFLSGFADHITKNDPQPWTTQVAGHPPGALLTFVGLDRIGLGGAGWAAAACVLVGCTASVSVPVTLHALGATAAARTAVPFLVLFPGAVWVGVSADGVYTGVVAAGVAMLAVGAAGRGLRADAASVAGGVLLGAGLYLSYGLVLMALPAVGVAIVSRRVRPLLVGAAGVAAVVLAFTAAGFWWWSGYQDLLVRYADGVAAGRPYSYWVWADLAAVALAAGPATVAGVRRVGAAVLPSAGRPDRTRRPVVIMVGAAAAAILVADLSGLSKAEVERIWLPFTVWLGTAAVLLPTRTHRGWLAAQVVTAVAINHLLLTNW